MKNALHSLIIAFILASLLLPACAPARSTPMGTPVPTKLKVLITPFLSFAPYFIAQEEGYFAEQGLEVEFVQMQQATEAVPILVQGKLDVLAGFINVGLLNAMTKDAKVKLVANKGYLATSGCAADSFMVAKDVALQTMLDDPDQRKAVRFSANPASVEGYFISKLVAPYGMTLKDVKIEYIADPAAELEALKNGSVEAAIVSEPWVTRITQAGAGQVWKSVGDIAPNFQSGVVAYGPTLLSQDRRAGERFMTAYLKGVRRFSEGKTERNLEIIAKYTKLDPQLLKELCWSVFRSDGAINVQSITEFADWARKNGLLEGGLTEEMFWDGSFVKFANQAIGDGR